MIRLKKVEEMVEVHYNSGQFANTMEHLVKEFPSPFDLYVELGEYYEKMDCSGSTIPGWHGMKICGSLSGCRFLIVQTATESG